MKLSSRLFNLKNHLFVLDLSLSFLELLALIASPPFWLLDKVEEAPLPRVLLRNEANEMWCGIWWLWLWFWGGGKERGGGGGEENSIVDFVGWFWLDVFSVFDDVALKFTSLILVFKKEICFLLYFWKEK